MFKFWLTILCVYPLKQLIKKYERWMKVWFSDYFLKDVRSVNGHYSWFYFHLTRWKYRHVNIRDWTILNCALLFFSENRYIDCNLWLNKPFETYEKKYNKHQSLIINCCFPFIDIFSLYKSLLQWGLFSCMFNCCLLHTLLCRQNV